MTIPPIRMRRLPPTIAPELWNVHDITLINGSRTNNICEGWNNAFAKLIGRAHPTIWHAIDFEKTRQWHPHCYCKTTGVILQQNVYTVTLSNYHPSSWIYAQPTLMVLNQWRLPSKTLDTASDGSWSNVIQWTLTYAIIWNSVQLNYIIWKYK